MKLVFLDVHLSSIQVIISLQFLIIDVNSTAIDSLKRGNDYVYINCFDQNVIDPENLSILLSDRRYGIGGDGIILINPSNKADAFMRIFNKDGSEGKMCGNGIRCVAKYLYDVGISKDLKNIKIETLSGVKTVEILENIGFKSVPPLIKERQYLKNNKNVVPPYNT